MSGPPNVSHMFIEEREIAKDVYVAVDLKHLCFTIMDKDRLEVYPREDIDSFQFCFLERGTLRQSRLEGFVVFRFKAASSVFDNNVAAEESVVLAVSGSYNVYNWLDQMMSGYRRIAPVELLPFARFPACVNAAIPQVERFADDEDVKELIQKSRSSDEYPSPPSVMMYDASCPMSVRTLVLSSDDESEQPPQASYYCIEGLKMQISQEGINSLRAGNYINDEIVDTAFKRLQGRHPDVFVFDTCATAKIYNVFKSKTMIESNNMSKEDFNRQFGSYFIKNGRPLAMSETFFSKRMIVFPICHMKHWILVVVVNPLLADQINAHDPEKPTDYKAAAYYLDSLPRLKKYTPKLMQLRLQQTWTTVLPFLRLGAFLHFHTFIRPDLLPIHSDNNLPLQRNNIDCGPHAVVNGSLMARQYEELMTGPTHVLISGADVAELEEEANSFRDEYLDYLEECKI